MKSTQWYKVRLRISNFQSLCGILCFLKHGSYSLLYPSQALVGAARVEKSSAVRRAYASSAATVARNAPDARVGKLVAEAVEMYTEPGDRESRQLGGLILRELARNAADVFGKHASQVPVHSTDWY